MTPDQVESCLAVGREALMQLVEMLADGARTRAEIYKRARVEVDALVCLLDEVVRTFAFLIRLGERQYPPSSQKSPAAQRVLHWA